MSDTAPAYFFIKNSCFECDKKLKLHNTFECKCLHIFCRAHRFPDQHSCTFDFKKKWKEELEKKNPIIKTKKLDKI